MRSDLWTYPDQSSLGVDVTRGVDLTGFAVEALDGGIGKIDEATYDVGGSYIVVDTGLWIFGKKVLLPAGVIDRVDLDEERVSVGRTKDEIKDAPDFDPDGYTNDDYRSSVGFYYGPEGAGWREPGTTTY